MTTPPLAKTADTAGETMKRTILATAPRSLSVAYVLELRRLVREDTYSTVHVADEVARRLLHSGDL